MNKSFISLLAVAFFGGMMAQFFILPQPLQAESPKEVVHLEKFYLKSSASLVTDQAGGNLSLNTSKGKLRFQAGIYANGKHQGNPFIAFYGSSKEPRLLFHLAGPNEAPQLLFKDSQGETRILMGLDETQPQQLPVIRYKNINEQEFENLLPEAMPK